MWSQTVTKAIFPYVTFTCSRQNKSFCLPRERIVHTEDFEERGDDGDKVLNTSKTYVVFLNPSPQKKGTLHAVVDMPLADFRDTVIRPAWEGVIDETLEGLGGARMSVTEHRPWGSFTILADEPDHKVKRIVIDAGKQFSKQLHHKRSEYWTVVSGDGNIMIGEQGFSAEPGTTFFIPRGVIHRAYACPVNGPLVFIEVQLGSYFGEDDIERLEDDFGRIPAQD